MTKLVLLFIVALYITGCVVNVNTNIGSDNGMERHITGAAVEQGYSAEKKGLR